MCGSQVAVILKQVFMDHVAKISFLPDVIDACFLAGKNISHYASVKLLRNT